MYYEKTRRHTSTHTAHVATHTATHRNIHCNKKTLRCARLLWCEFGTGQCFPILIVLRSFWRGGPKFWLEQNYSAMDLNTAVLPWRGKRWDKRQSSTMKSSKTSCMGLLMAQGPVGVAERMSKLCTCAEARYSFQVGSRAVLTTIMRLPRMLCLFWNSTLHLKGSLAGMIFMEPSSKNTCFQQYTEAMGWLQLVDS